MRLTCLTLPLFLLAASTLALADDPAVPQADNAARVGRGSPDPASDKKTPTFATDVLPFLKAHCFQCHGTEDGKDKADLTLSKYTDDLSVQQDRKVWDNVVHMLQNGEMPPMERKRPPAADIEAVIQSIEGVLANLDCSQKPNVGRVTVRRLNKAEYNNTVRDLLGVDFQPAADFPSDDVGYGFDNIGDVLSTTPLLFERYLAAAETVLQKAIVVPETIQPKDVRLQGLRVSRGAGEETNGGGALFGEGDAGNETFLDAGDYKIQVEVYCRNFGDEKPIAEIRLNREPVQKFEVSSTKRSDLQILETKIRVPAATARLSVAFLNPYIAPDHTDENPRRRILFVRSIVADGPYNPPPPPAPPHQQKLLAHREGLEPREAAREIIERFAARAFRRPVQPAEVEHILRVYDLAEKEGEKYEDRLRLALCRILISPRFLFRIEKDAPGAKAGEAYAISELELASRLSYFLWSTMPDDELVNLAAHGQLRANLPAQINRLLSDPRSNALVENFAGQWLTLRKLPQVTPDIKVFPDFDEDLRAAMQKETELFFADILRENKSILHFLDADFTYVNGRLAKHYGINGVEGSEFQKVSSPSNRGGLLTQASILTLTSAATRTSPVKRGKWILEQLLGTPPPPPPPDVPDLDEKKTLSGTLRQVMEQHRENPICASCHARMDPIGFAFENYDAIGKFREKDGQFPIDPAGELPDGRKFQGPAELKTILKDKKELFARSLAEKMLTYALGRGVEYYDKCALDKIVAALEQDDYRMRTLIAAIISSDPFQMRTASGEKSQNTSTKSQTNDE